MSLAALSLSACAKEEQATPAAAPATTAAPAEPKPVESVPARTASAASTSDASTTGTTGDDDPAPPAFEQESRTAPTVILTDADAERRVVLAEDEVLEVRLPADRQSGYTWIPAQHLLPVFSAYGIPEYELDESADTNPRGIEIWRFMAEEVGAAELVFEYRKPLGADEPPRQTRVFQLAVE